MSEDVRRRRRSAQYGTRAGRPCTLCFVTRVAVRYVRSGSARSTCSGRAANVCVCVHNINILVYDKKRRNYNNYRVLNLRKTVVVTTIHVRRGARRLSRQNSKDSRGTILILYISVLRRTSRHAETTSRFWRYKWVRRRGENEKIIDSAAQHVTQKRIAKIESKCFPRAREYLLMWSRYRFSRLNKIRPEKRGQTRDVSVSGDFKTIQCDRASSWFTSIFILSRCVENRFLTVL